MAIEPTKISAADPIAAVDILGTESIPVAKVGDATARRILVGDILTAPMNDPLITITGGVIPATTMSSSGGAYIAGQFVSMPGPLIGISSLTLDSSTTAFDSGLIRGRVGGFTITGDNAVSALMPNFAVTTDLFNFKFANSTTIDLSGLQVVGAAFSVTTKSTTLSAPALSYVGGAAFGGSAVSLVQTVDLGSLAYIGNGLSGTFTAATSVDLGSLVTIVGTFSSDFSAATTLNLDSLQTVGSMTCKINALSTLSLPALKSSGSIVPGATAAALTTVTLNSGLLSVGGNVTLTGAALTQASVDHILVRLAALDGTGGTTSYNSKVVNLSGGTSSTPGVPGLAAKVTLELRSNTVTVN